MDQVQMYYAAERRAGELNELFLEMVRDGMTRDELQKLIDKRPERYGRFSNWLDRLPKEEV